MRLLSVMWNRYRPVEGWLPVFLLTAAVGCLVGAVLEASWTPEIGVVAPAAFWSLFLGLLLARRPLRPWFAWFLITLYGLAGNVIWLGQLRPPLSILLGGWWASGEYIRQHAALFIDRMASWFKAAFTGGASQETIVFAFALGLLAWYLAAYVAWSIFRRRRPLPGLMALGLALAVNSYYGAAHIGWTAAFVALAALIAAVMHYANLEREWHDTGVDYSAEIRFDLILYAGATALLLLLLALALPAFSITRLAQAFAQQPAVAQTEETLERVFAGVQQPRRTGPGPGMGQGGVAASGLPRAFLLGNPPELHETLIMTATVQITSTVVVEPLPVTHWRGFSYDVYTGRGWALSEERRQPVAANESIPLPATEGQMVLTQSVHWLYDARGLRYTLGLPRRFDHDVEVSWRGLEDLSRVYGEGEAYTAVSQVTLVSPDRLRQATITDVPPVILARYTLLPETVPARVHVLAQEVAGALQSPYDQARTLERFLRQYPYSLQVEAPPIGADPVDFFLFDLQRGYCDYFASAMVVMARSLGLPARLAVGFLAQPPDEQGLQTINQIHAHSWAEVYFAGYGWVEFEPTGPFFTYHNPTSSQSIRPFAPEPDIDPLLPQPPPIPAPSTPEEPIPWGRYLFLALLA